MPLEYVVSHLREQLAREAGELGIAVDVVEERLVLSGVVVTAERRELAERIARSMSDGRAVVNEIRVLPPARPGAPERLS